MKKEQCMMEESTHIAEIYTQRVQPEASAVGGDFSVECGGEVIRLISLEENQKLSVNKIKINAVKVNGAEYIEYELYGKITIRI